MSDFYNTASDYKRRIIRLSEVLAGNEMPASLSDWQSVAADLEIELRRYADWLGNARNGHVRGPIVFPSWVDETAKE